MSTAHDHLTPSVAAYHAAGSGAARAVPPDPPLTKRAAPTTYHEAAARGDGFVVIQPDGTWLAGFPTMESAQAFALSMNDWLAEPATWLAAWKARRPDPNVVAPFFDTREIPDTSEERLLRILGPWRFER